MGCEEDLHRTWSQMSDCPFLKHGKHRAFPHALGVDGGGGYHSGRKNQFAAKPAMARLQVRSRSGSSMRSFNLAYARSQQPQHYLQALMQYPKPRHRCSHLSFDVGLQTTPRVAFPIYRISGPQAHQHHPLRSPCVFAHTHTSAGLFPHSVCNVWRGRSRNISF